MTSAPGVEIRGQLAFAGYPPLPVELELPSGRWTCLLGPSGVGKSTLLRLLAGLPAGGRLEGDICVSDGVLLSGRTSYMAQSDLLAPWLDVTGNVLLGAHLRGETPDHASAAELIEKIGLKEHAGKRPPALSGGMRQRTALARTLMEDRPVALLDEPFSALDARTRADMQDLAFCLLAGRTVLLVTHDPAEAARLADRIYILTETGLAPHPLPAGPPLRAVDDPSVLSVQTELLARLRETA